MRPFDFAVLTHTKTPKKQPLSKEPLHFTIQKYICTAKIACYDSYIMPDETAIGRIPELVNTQRIAAPDNG